MRRWRRGVDRRERLAFVPVAIAELRGGGAGVLGCWRALATGCTGCTGLPARFHAAGPWIRMPISIHTTVQYVRTQQYYHIRPLSAPPSIRRFHPPALCHCLCRQQCCRHVCRAARASASLDAQCACPTLPYSNQVGRPNAQASIQTSVAGGLQRSARPG